MDSFLNAVQMTGDWMIYISLTGLFLIGTSTAGYYGAQLLDRCGRRLCKFFT